MPRGGKHGRRGGRGGMRGGKHKGGIARIHSSNGAIDGRDSPSNWTHESIQKNKFFEAYYHDQKIVQEGEWQTFMDHLRAPLPTSFRITSGKPTTNVLLDQMKNFYLPFLRNVEFEGEPVPPPKALPWYPENMGWQIDVKKNALRKTDQFRRFQHFLVHETEVGNISRQETVSMIPPLFLNVEPHHIVLDMCAAPGSKTAQLIEALHSPLTSSAESYIPCPPGMVIANDTDAKRAHMLVHQSSRLPSPNIVVANCDASRWPSIRVPWCAEGSERIQDRTMKFDRILADVPCSGDGTLRKNLMIWKDWHPHNGSSLHPLQLRILIRGLQCLRNGGRLVYSTCSLNPIEDEAVVAQALRECKGGVRLVDQSDAFPKLKRHKGLFTWKVCPTKGSKDKLTQIKTSTDGQPSSETNGTQDGPREGEPSYRSSLPELPYIESWNDLSAEWKDRIPKSLWPQGDEEALGLDKCMRVLPHDQNTGGFFVAVLEKHDGSDEDLAEGMALGMIRAMEKKDAKSDKIKQEIKVKEESDINIKQESTNSDDIKETLKRPLSPENDTEAKPEEDFSNKKAKVDDEETGLPVAKIEDVGQPGGAPYREDPMNYVDPENAQSASIVSWFSFGKGFDNRNLLVRNSEATPLRSVYYTSTSVRAMITSGGQGKGEHPFGNPLKMRLINCGVRAFARQDAGKDPNLQCKWRVISDAIPVLRPLVGSKVVIDGKIEDLKFMISNHYPKLTDIPESSSKEFRERMEGASSGSHFVDVAPGEYEGNTLERTLCVPVWRAPASLNLMLERNEKSALSFRIFGTDLSNPSGARQFTLNKTQQAAKKRQEQEDAERKMKVDEDELQDLENSAFAAAAAASDVKSSSIKMEIKAEDGIDIKSEIKEEESESDLKQQIKEEGQELPSEK